MRRVQAVPSCWIGFRHPLPPTTNWLPFHARQPIPPVVTPKDARRPRHAVRAGKHDIVIPDGQKLVPVQTTAVEQFARARGARCPSDAVRAGADRARIADCHEEGCAPCRAGQIVRRAGGATRPSDAIRAGAGSCPYRPRRRTARQSSHLVQPIRRARATGRPCHAVIGAGADRAAVADQRPRSVPLVLRRPASSRCPRCAASR